MKRIIDFVDSLKQTLQPIRKSFETLEQKLQPWLQVINEAQKERARITSLIDSEEISFSEKIDQLPKVDPKVLLAHLLIENMAEKKTGAKCKNAGDMWDKFFSKYESSLDKFFDEKSTDEWLHYIFFLDHFLKWKDAEKGKKRIGSEARNLLVHEIDCHQSMKDPLSYFLNYTDKNPSLSDLEKTYDLIKNLPS